MSTASATFSPNVIDAIDAPDTTHHPRIDDCNLQYLVNRADDLFKTQRYLGYYAQQGKVPTTALLESTTLDLTTFKRMWKRFQERFFKRYGGTAIGTVERHTDGTLHAHLFVVFPDGTADQEILGTANDQWREIWQDIHQRFTGTALEGLDRGRMRFKPPEDGCGTWFARYVAKAYNRSERPAKWGSVRNQTFLLTAGIRGAGRCWQWQELPSRSKSKRAAAEWALAEFEKARKRP